jgi:membrane-bound lytic murein transglycosylase D
LSHLIVISSRTFHIVKLSCSLILSFFALGGCVQPNGLASDTDLAQKTDLLEQSSTSTLATTPPVENSSDTPVAVIDNGAWPETDTRIEWPETAHHAIAPITHLTGPPAASRRASKRVYLDVTKQDLWQVFIQRQDWKYEHNARVASQLNWFAKNPNFIHRVAQRCTPYFYHIVSELEKNDLPVELALLPIIESAYRPFAFSRGRATGIWQFIPSTGREFGLKQNWWYDGRRDIVASTNAAIRFFKQLETKFDGDWLHALAAYNAGPAKVRRSIAHNRKKNLPTTFWDLKLPRETRDYVPKFLALIEVIRHPQAYGIDLPPIEATPYFAAIDTKRQIDLAWAAENANTSIKQLYWLNPGFNRWATAPDGPHRLLVPAGSAADFKLALSELNESYPVTWTRHKIKSGETLGAIAKRYETTVRHLKIVNHLNGDLIVVGRNIMIPTPSALPSAYVFSASQRLEAAQSRGSGFKHVHRVRSGDTLWDLARSYNSSIGKIAKWNNIATKTPLQVGQTLVIWRPGARELAAATPAVAFVANFQPDIQIVRYVVRPGDSLNRIAQRFNIQLADLFRWNSGLRNVKYIQPGQKIRLELDVRQQSG